MNRLLRNDRFPEISLYIQSKGTLINDSIPILVWYIKKKVEQKYDR